MQRTLATFFPPVLQKPKKLYLTIDDGPSEHTNEIVAFLKLNNISAIFFFRGDSLKVRMDIAINSIRWQSTEAATRCHLGQ